MHEWVSFLPHEQIKSSKVLIMEKWTYVLQHNLDVRWISKLLSGVNYSVKEM